MSNLKLADEVSHPTQPFVLSEQGTIRFKRNDIIDRLFERGIIDLNQIATWRDIKDEHHRQFAQLLGYSVSGYGDLSFVSSDPDALAVIDLMLDEDITDERDAKIAYLEHELEQIRAMFREPAARLFKIHPSDLDPTEINF